MERKNGYYTALVTTVTIICIALMQINMGMHGYDGTVYTTAVSSIGVIIGWYFKTIHTKITGG